MTKFFNKFKKPCFDSFLDHFPNFGANLENLALSCTSSYGFLAPYKNLEKNKDTIQRNCSNRQKDGRMDGRMDGRTGRRVE